MAENNFVNKTVQITQEQQKWLENNEWMNFSGWVREKLQELIEEEKGKENPKGA